jgi:hypothetical protein
MQLPGNTTRREFLRGTAVSAAAASLAAVVPARVLGREGNVPPGEKITLGVIGVGPRCAYNLQAMVRADDVRFVAVAEVQARRRETGKAFLDHLWAFEESAAAGEAGVSFGIAQGNRIWICLGGLALRLGWRWIRKLGFAIGGSHGRVCRLLCGSR